MGMSSESMLRMWNTVLSIRKTQTYLHAIILTYNRNHKQPSVFGGLHKAELKANGSF